MGGRGITNLFLKQICSHSFFLRISFMAGKVGDMSKTRDPKCLTLTPNLPLLKNWSSVCY